MQTSSIPRPIASSPHYRLRAKGFTLVELMITVAIGAILLGVAIPSFTSFIKNQTVKTASFDLTSSLNFARSEAIKRNNNTVMSPTAGNWENGWTVTTTDSATGTTSTLYARSAIPGVTITGPAANLTYGNDGRVQGVTAPSFQINGDSSTRCISINLSGLPHSKSGSCS